MPSDEPTRRADDTKKGKKRLIWTRLRAMGILKRRIAFDTTVAVFSAATTASFSKVAGASTVQAGYLFGGTFFLVGLLIAPALLSTLVVIEDFMRLSRVDTALLGGISWHPDLSITGLQLPSTIKEGDQNQRLVVTIQYKPLVTLYQGAISGTATLKLEPLLLEPIDMPFRLIPDEEESRIVFKLEPGPFRAEAIGQLIEEQQLPSSGQISCRLTLEIESPWELRTVRGAPNKRKVTLHLGSIKAELFNTGKWADRMARDGYLTVLPNGLAFNPVLTSSRSPDVATNVVIASRHWHQKYLEGETEAKFLLLIAARLLALQIATEPDPEIHNAIPNQSDPAADDLNLKTNVSPDDTPPSDHQLEETNEKGAALLADLEVLELRTCLATQASIALNEMRKADVARSASEALRGTKQTYVVETQHLVDDQLPGPTHAVPLSLLGLTDRVGKHVLLSAEPHPAVDDASDPWPLERAITPASASKIAAEQRPKDNFPNLLNVKPGPEPADTDHPNLPFSWQTPSNVDGIDSLLGSIESVLQAAHVVTSGFYIQPQPVRQTHWLDLDATSHALAVHGLEASIRELVLATVRSLMNASRAKTSTIYNCCSAGGASSDHRLRALRDLSAAGPKERVVHVTYQDNARWTGLTEPIGDSFVISALSNDYTAFSSLLDYVARHKQPTVFVPLFGPIEPTHAAIGGLLTSRGVHVLPLFVWDNGESRYRASTRTEDYRGMWTILRRHEAEPDVGPSDV